MARQVFGQQTATLATRLPSAVRYIATRNRTATYDLPDQQLLANALFGTDPIAT